MDTDLTIFWRKVHAVGDTLRVNEDYKVVAPILRELVVFVRERPNMKDQFEAAFIEIMERPQGYSMLVVVYSMHFLRFQKVYQYAEDRWSRSALRTDSDARFVLDAYSDEWPLKSLFKNND